MAVTYVGNLGLPQMTNNHKPWGTEINQAWGKLNARLAGTSTGVPTATGFFVGQRHYDKTNQCWYTCVATGGPGTWVKDLELAGMRSVPPGCIMDFAGTTAPAGWLLCAGQAVSRTTYAALFAAVGTVYGTGNGTTTFNVPDLRGRASFGKDNMGGTAAGRLTGAGLPGGGNTLGNAGGEQTHSHTGTVTVHANTSQKAVADGGDTAATSTHTHVATVSIGSAVNIPPAIVLNKIIKV